MKIPKCLFPRLALPGALALLIKAAFPAHAAKQPPPPPPPVVTWQTVDDFQNAVGKASVAAAMTIDPHGNLFVTGNGIPASGAPPHALIEKSSDGGATWTTCDDYVKVVPTSGFGYYAANYVGITSDPVGNLYAVLNTSGTTSGVSIVRQSLDGGITWTTVDELYQGVPHGIATDSAGNVYVVGGGPISHWWVRKGTLASGSWSTEDDFLPAPGYVSASPSAVFCHPTAGIFVAGTAAVGPGGAFRATVRRSLDGGATWSIVDSAISGTAYAIGADAAGNVYTVSTSWTVRKSSNGGNTWTTVDALGSGTPQSFSADANGNLFVVGYSASSPAQWIVRENPGGNTSWSTVDTFQYAGTGTLAKAAACDALGHVYVAGYGGAPQHWLVRKH